MLGAFSNRYVSADAVCELRFLFRSDFAMNLIGTEFKDAPKQCRVDAIAVLTELENEPNCLDSGFPVRGHISFILS